MRPELPWNVAGIPPEAREAARAAARRDGLSVGEWLTRRILRSLSDLGEPADSGRDDWENGNSRHAAEQTSSRRDTDNMLAHVSRSEDESQGAYRRIEDQLRTLGRRIDSAERGHSENNRAMSKAAAEINVAAREQTQAFDQLGAHVVGLGDRLDRVERRADDGSSRDAVKGLQNGLSRLADQISQTANESSAQIASLAGNVESLATKLVQARGDAENASRGLEQRLYALDDRVRASEKLAQDSAGAADKAAETFAARASAPDPEVQRHAAALAQFGETLDRLTAKFAANEHQTTSAVTRLEETIARLDSRNAEGGLDRRLQGIERVLGDIAGRLDTAERNTAGAAATVEDGLKAITQKVDASDKRNRDAIAEMRSNIKTEHGDNYATQPPHLQAMTGNGSSNPPMLDMPPFPDTAHAAAQNTFQQPADPFAPPPHTFDAPPSVTADPPPATMTMGNDPFAPQTQPYAGPSGGESYLAAARRAANAAAMQTDADRSRGPMGAFTWGTSRGADTEETKKPTRYLLIGSLVLLAIVAAVAGVMLSQRLGGDHTTPSNGIGSLFTKNQPAQLQLAPQATQVPPSAETPAAQSPVAVAPKPAVAPDAQVTAKHVAVPAAQQTATTAIKPPVAASTTQQKPAVLPTTQPKPGQTASLPAPQQLAALASQGNVTAQTTLGLKYLDGDGVPQNDAEAARWLERAASQGQPVAEYRLGTLYERGRGVKADPAKATHWYEAAAKQGNRKAMHNLAVAYAEGAGEKKDYPEAARWFSKAAALGLADSQFNLAVLYERGLGVPQSLVDAYKWYAIAAAGGDTESKARIDALTTQLSPAERDAAQKAAATFEAQQMNRAANVPPDAGASSGG